MKKPAQVTKLRGWRGFGHPSPPRQVAAPAGENKPAFSAAQNKRLVPEASIRHWLFESNIRWLIYILLLELVLAYLTTPTILADHPLFNSIVAAMQSFVPALGYIGSRVVHPDAVRFYIAVTLILAPLKVAFWFWLLNLDRMGWYQHLVISPLTDRAPTSGLDFIKEPIYRDSFAPRPEQESRSMASRVIWSLLILMFAVVMVVMLIYGGDDYFSLKKYKAMSDGGLSLWFAWSFKETSFVTALMAISLCIIRDYVAYIRQFVVRTRATHIP